MNLPVLPLILILGYPALTIAFLALARGLAFRAPFASGILHQVVYLLLPTGGIWLILHFLAELPADDWAVRVAETIFAQPAIDQPVAGDDPGMHVRIPMHGLVAAHGVGGAAAGLGEVGGAKAGSGRRGDRSQL